MRPRLSGPRHTPAQGTAAPADQGRGRCLADQRSLQLIRRWWVDLTATLAAKVEVPLGLTPTDEPGARYSTASTDTYAIDRVVTRNDGRQIPVVPAIWHTSPPILGGMASLSGPTGVRLASRLSDPDQLFTGTGPPTLTLAQARPFSQWGPRWGNGAVTPAVVGCQGPCLARSRPVPLRLPRRDPGIGGL
jgi:hypothetical protein